MDKTPDILRTLVIYAVIVPLALFIGYMMANPLDTSTFIESGLIVAVLLFPLLLRWHHPLLIISWNLGMYLFFLPGQPDLWMMMALISLLITVLQRAMGAVKQLINVPQVTLSLVFLVAVVVFTAKMTGMGLRTAGSEVYGGKKYVYLLVAILGYFALSSRRIPPERANLYVALFFLPGLMNFLDDLWPFIPESLRYIYAFFHASASKLEESTLEYSTRFYGGMMVAIAMFSYMQARYGIRGIFLFSKPWRWMILMVVFFYGMLGGFRSGIMLIALPFVVQFYLEGLHRTKLLPIFAVLGMMMAVALIPLASHLPYTAQRALSFLPLNVDPVARLDAEGTADWRVDMWKALLPQVPKYLMLGKGYAMSVKDFQLLGGYDAAVRTTFDEDQLMALSGTYHNGPLTCILIFGIWGAIGLVWFWAAGIWVLYNNYRYGYPALHLVNTFLLSVFVARILLFLLIVGDFGSDMFYFCGFLGLGVSLNGGVSRPVPAPAREANKYQAFVGVRAHLQPSLRRPQIGG